MISNIATHITETDLRSALRTVCERAQAPLFNKVYLITALRVAYIVFPTAEAAAKVLDVSPSSNFSSATRI